MDHKQRNLELVDKWAELYNNEGSRFVSEFYTENVVVDCPGSFLIKGREAFVAIEDAICSAAPKRWIRIDRKIAEGDVVVVQGTWFDPDQGDDVQPRFCSVLTFDDDGLIVNDTTYLDASCWPKLADIAGQVKGPSVESKVPVQASDLLK